MTDAKPKKPRKPKTPRPPKEGADTPPMVREQGFISIRDLCAELGISRPALYKLLAGLKHAPQEITVGERRRYFKRADIIKALFPANGFKPED